MASLEDLIPVVNKLQDLVFNTIGSDTLDLPQVVVVGSQSCGKSSVLENIVGRDFLPRGTGIVTRRPLILQLVNMPADRPPSPELEARGIRGNEWGEFLHVPGRRFYDFQEIRNEIEAETSRIAGSNKGINRLPINLKIYSPHVLNLTLVDLPGLTKIPIGDQPTDIEKQTRALILEYIAKPNSIILAVSPANVDLVNSESLKLARQVDPQGKRTIGVLTKLDLMDQGTNALDILSGHVYPLKLGFIGVVNRSQQDIQANKSLDDSLQAERTFFASHPVYKNISHKCGTSYLAKSLNQTLMGHIRERLPDIKARLNTLMGQTEQELASLGNDAFAEHDSKGTLILQLMTRFASSFTSSIDGTSSEISTKELCGGARIYFIYNDVFGQSLSKIDPTANLSTTDIRTAIRNSTGPRASLFVPELAFDLLVKPQIKLLESPSQRCVELVYEELMKICHNCGSAELARFPKLQTKLIEVISDLLRERLGPTSSYVSSLIMIQRAYINTNHPNFLGAASAMSAVLAERQAAEKEKERAMREAALLAERAASPEAEEVNGSIDEDTQHKLQNGHVEKRGKHRHHASEHKSDTASAILNNNPLHPSASTGNLNGGTPQPKDSFLNYFFGKDPVNGRQSPLAASARGTPPAQAARYHHAPQPFTTDGPHFESMSQEFEAALDSDDHHHLTEREQLECELIRRLIKSYFDIVRETIQDQVPKAVMHLLVNFSKEAAQNRLVSELYKEALFDELLYEDEALAQERKKCKNMLSTYKEAAKIISEVI
ncbi:dynamin-related protein Dnm1p [Trichomonascus vanleenenianus]|uniref:dynamin-related GTPase DNM1 n=1 Tax=Trichomonascus vanleenenianus TaxID=2268995 RepID=UPI003ECAA010